MENQDLEIHTTRDGYPSDSPRVFIVRGFSILVGIRVAQALCVACGAIITEIIALDT